jgi:hypothetical protein
MCGNETKVPQGKGPSDGTAAGSVCFSPRIILLNPTEMQGHDDTPSEVTPLSCSGSFDGGFHLATPFVALKEDAPAISLVNYQMVLPARGV